MLTVPAVPLIWDQYRSIIGKYEEQGARELAINKYEFYERSKEAYAVVTTGETAFYANVILKKGVAKE